MSEVRHERDLLPLWSQLPARLPELPAGLSVRRELIAAPPRGQGYRRREGETPAEPLLSRQTRLGGSLALPNSMSDKPTILVLCTGNSARSQMAEAFLRKYQGDRIIAASAGTQPKQHVHPLAVRVMKEIGIDISHQRPWDVSEFLGKAPVHHVLIVCDHANQSCPRIWPGTFSRTFMPFDDPAAAAGSEAEKLAVFRRVRDEIDAAMREWIPDESKASP